MIMNLGTPLWFGLYVNFQPSFLSISIFLFAGLCFGSFYVRADFIFIFCSFFSHLFCPILFFPCRDLLGVLQVSGTKRPDLIRKQHVF